MDVQKSRIVKHTNNQKLERLMRKMIPFVALVLSASLLLPSCVAKKKYDELLNNKEELDKMLGESKAKVKNLEGDLAELQDQKSQLEATNSEMSGRISDLEASQRELLADQEKIQSALEAAEKRNKAIVSTIDGNFAPAVKGGLTLTQRNGKVYVQMPEPILFKSGSTRVQKKYLEQIDKVSEVLKANPDMRVQVEGHTDSKKMKSGARFQDNWELSTARALGVVRRLIKNGVSETQVAAVGKGEFLPVNSDDGNAEAHMQNRRVEFLIMPNAAELYQIGKEGA